MVCINELKQKSVAIFGTGFHATRCLYYLRESGIKVMRFFNNNPTIESLGGIEVFLPNAKTVKGVYVLVASMENTYAEIAKQLLGFGLEEFNDFVYYGWMEKKIVLLHGNCHMQVIKEYLNSAEDFRDKYAIYPNPLICENKEGKIAEYVLENCDVWIHEDIREENTFGYYLSDKGIREKINPNVTEIVIPHLFGYGKMLFLQVLEENRNNEAIANGFDTNGIFPFADKVIEMGYEKGLSVEEIIILCKSNDALVKEEITSNFEVYMEKVLEREKSWDIKIYDFLKANYKKHKLFYDPHHPTNIVLKKISSEILKRLDVTYECIRADYCLDAHEIPVYPIAKDVLQLEWDEKEIRKSKSAKKLSAKMDFEEYIREYIWWCYEDKT